MRKLYELMRQIGPSHASVILVGDSGTGKELAARTLHELSPRRGGPFVAVNCAAIPETLLEGEIFGHEKGAFTGANQRRAGYFEQANDGTLFLDELCSMPASSQAKLLRVLEERSFRRLRGSEDIRVDVRVVAAMRLRPELAVRRGMLNSDLYYRLNVFTLDLPTLRERVTDIPLLSEHFIEEFNRINQKSIGRPSEEALAALLEYEWPGNVRELRNVLERAVILSKGSRIELSDLPPTVLRREGVGGEPSRVSFEVEDEMSVREGEGLIILRLGTTIEEANRELIRRTLEATGYNKTQAATMLGVSAKTIYNKLRRWEGEEAGGDCDRGKRDRRKNPPRQLKGVVPIIPFEEARKQRAASKRRGQGGSTIF